jgi:hypothetical protein
MEKSWNAWVWIKWKPGTPSTAWEQWRDHDSIAQAWSTQGEWDCCLCLNIHDHDKLEEFVWKEVRSNQWVESTSTMWAKKWW